MVETALFVLVGTLVGVALSLLYFRQNNKKELEKAKLTGMCEMYKEILEKRKHSDFRYSELVRRSIDRVHMSDFVK